VKQGNVTVQGGRAMLELPDTGALASGDKQSSAEQSLTPLTEADAPAMTIVAHTEREGRIASTRGALSFRVGNIFAGLDEEGMRLPEEGNLGIGTAKPEAKLDVAGAVRARQGFMFNDGSTLNVNEKGALILTGSDGTVAPNAAGTGTQNRLAKWLETGGAGTLGDSGVTELANGFVGIGTTNPQVRLDVVDDTSVVGGFQLTNHTNGSLAQLQNRLANNAGALAYYGITSSAYTQAPILSNRAFFGSNAVDTVIWTQGANDILFATNGLSGAAERMRIKSSGNIGIGTSNPLREFQLGPSSDALFTFSPSDGSPNAGYIRFGDQTGWKLHFARSRESSGGPLNSETTGELMTIQDNGNVGIGTVSPQVKLEVRGDVKLGSGSQLFAPGGLENLRI